MLEIKIYEKFFPTGWIKNRSKKNERAALHFLAQVSKIFIIFKMLKLYQFTNCPYCEKVRRKLAELGLEYEKIEVDRANKPKVVLDLGGIVPVIDDNGMIMNESEDIVKYLEEKYGNSQGKG